MVPGSRPQSVNAVVCSQPKDRTLSKDMKVSVRRWECIVAQQDPLTFSTEPSVGHPEQGN